MSKKRKAAESSSNEQTNEDSDPAFQQEKNAKRAKLASLSDTTLQDLPLEMVECILVKAVVMEVRSMKLVKCVWKEKADLVISRLTTVCSQWDSILTTNFFQNEVHRNLDGAAQETIQVEILHQFPIQCFVSKLTTIKAEIFMLCIQNDKDYVINVHERNNLEEVKEVIPLPGYLRPWDMAACNVSNCLYIGVLNEESQCRSVLRVKKDEDNQFNISTWITDLGPNLDLPMLSVSANGSLMIVDRPIKTNFQAISIYVANGSLQHTIVLPEDIYGFTWLPDVVQKPDGNLILVSLRCFGRSGTGLTEIDTRGNIVRHYKSALQLGETDVSVADIHGRILITNWHNKMEILDSELRLLDFVDPQLHDGEYVYFPSRLHYNSERNEMMRMSYLADKSRILTIFRFTEK